MTQPIVQSERIELECKSQKARSTDEIHNVQCRKDCPRFARRVKLFECEDPRHIVQDIFHHAPCYNITLTEVQISQSLIKCAGFGNHEVLGPADIGDYNQVQSSEDELCIPVYSAERPQLYDDNNVQDIENGTVTCKAVVFSILNELVTTNPKNIKWSWNAKIDYNWTEIFRNGIQPSKILDLCLDEIGWTMKSISLVTIDSQFEDKHIKIMNKYKRPEIIARYNPNTQQHQFNNFKFIKTPGARRNESLRYHIELYQPHRNCSQLYTSVHLFYYANNCAHRAVGAMDRQPIGFIRQNEIDTNESENNYIPPTQIHHQAQIPNIFDNEITDNNDTISPNNSHTNTTTNSSRQREIESLFSTAISHFEDEFPNLRQTNIVITSPNHNTNATNISNTSNSSNSSNTNPNNTNQSVVINTSNSSNPN
eukprot:282994_1